MREPQVQGGWARGRGRAGEAGSGGEGGVGADLGSGGEPGQVWVPSGW